jgi:hypothetical protein
MKRYFTNYWTNKTWDYNVGRMFDDSEKTLRHTASNMFRKRGVSEGDSLYIITVKGGQLLLLCKLTVGDMCGYEEGVRLLENENLWPAEDHILAESPAAIRRYLRSSDSPHNYTTTPLRELPSKQITAFHRAGNTRSTDTSRRARA